MRPGSKTEYSLEEGSYSLQQVVDKLQEEPFNPRTQYCETRLAGEINSKGLQTLANLPYEVTISRQGEEICLRTGGEEGSDLPAETDEGNLDVFLHTHPPHSDKDLVFDSPSLHDLTRAPDSSKEIKLGIAHPEGIIVYQQPTYYPNTDKEWEEEITQSHIEYYLEERDYTILLHKDSGYLQHLDEVSDEKVRDLTRGFAESTGSIVAEALWEDEGEAEWIVAELFD